MKNYHTRIPNNCGFLDPKRVKPEIWAISPTQRSKDIKLQAISTALTKSQAKTLEITNRLFELNGSTLGEFTPSQRELIDDTLKGLIFAKLNNRGINFREFFGFKFAKINSAKINSDIYLP